MYIYGLIMCWQHTINHHSALAAVMQINIFQGTNVSVIRPEIHYSGYKIVAAVIYSQSTCCVRDLTMRGDYICKYIVLFG